MTRATATQFKMKLGQYMQAVRAGKTVVVTDRAQPIARLVPFRAEACDREVLAVWQARDPAAPPLGELRVNSIHYAGRSTTKLLAEDRRRR